MVVRHWNFGLAQSDELDKFHDPSVADRLLEPGRILCQKWQFFTERIVVMGTPNNEPG
jgi:hypothetical protein